MRKFGSILFLAASWANPALAQDRVKLESMVFVERSVPAMNGRMERRIEPADSLSRGDRVVLMVEWRATDRERQGFAVTSPIPSSLSLQRVSHEGIDVSADGGRHWGKLGELQIRDAEGTRLASPQDVTHLRWSVSPGEASLGTGRMTYRAIVR